MKWGQLSWREIRDAALFVVGVAGTIHETFLVSGERRELLILYAAMLGLSGALRLDVIRKNGSQA